MLATGAPATAQPQLWLGNDGLTNTVLNTTTDGTVLRTLVQGANTGLAADPATNTLFLSERTGAIQTRDLTTLAVTGSIPSPDSSFIYEDLAWDGTFLYRGDFSFSRIFRIDRATGAETVFVTDFLGVVGVAHDSSDNTFWASSFLSGELRHYDATGAQLGTAITLSVGRGGLGYDPRDDTLWLGGNEQVFHITKQGVVLGSFNTPEFHNSDSRFVDGLEFIVPEPSAACAAAAAVVMTFLPRRRNRSSWKRACS